MTMAKKLKLDAAAYIAPLNMNGLQGRVLRLPPPPRRNREILLVYGHHASIERMFGLAEDINQYGAVTLPDLPGFGGMESFYKIGEKPTLDNMADYLAAFVKMRYKRRRVTIMGMSFGFIVVTRMLQRHPDLVKKIDLLISIVGFAHYEDFKFRRRNYLLMRYGASLFSNKYPSLVVKHIALRKVFIKMAYGLVADSHSKLKDADREERRRRVNFEVGLWQCNDVRTYMDTTVTMLTVDLCHKQIDLPVYHVTAAEDRYFNNNVVEQHLGVIFADVHVLKTKMGNHAPTVVASAKEAAPFVPPRIRRLLAKA